MDLASKKNTFRISDFHKKVSNYPTARSGSPYAAVGAEREEVWWGQPVIGSCDERGG
jgi:hypothetical protein